MLNTLWISHYEGLTLNAMKRLTLTVLLTFLNQWDGGHSLEHCLVAWMGLVDIWLSINIHPQLMLWSFDRNSLWKFSRQAWTSPKGSLRIYGPWVGKRCSHCEVWWLRWQGSRLRARQTHMTNLRWPTMYFVRWLTIGY